MEVMQLLICGYHVFLQWEAHTHSLTLRSVCRGTQTTLFFSGSTQHSFFIAHSRSLVVLQVDLDLVVDGVRAVLLVLGDGGLACHDLHLHGARQKQLLLLLLVLQVDAVD